MESLSSHQNKRQTKTVQLRVYRPTSKFHGSAVYVHHFYKKKDIRSDSSNHVMVHLWDKLDGSTWHLEQVPGNENTCIIRHTSGPKEKASYKCDKWALSGHLTMEELSAKKFLVHVDQVSSKNYLWKITHRGFGTYTIQLASDD